MEPLTKAAIGIAVSIAMKAGGKLTGPLWPITMASSMVSAVDAGMRSQVHLEVLRVNKTMEGFERTILLIKEYNGSQGRQFLDGVVSARGGGTAWYQASRGRMECFYYNRKDFVPTKGTEPKDHIGYVVHGATDGN